eukprot:jgi/Psemu1/27024/gm1.27024_g
MAVECKRGFDNSRHDVAELFEGKYQIHPIVPTNPTVTSRAPSVTIPISTPLRTKTIEPLVIPSPTRTTLVNHSKQSLPPQEGESIPTRECQHLNPPIHSNGYFQHQHAYPRDRLDDHIDQAILHYHRSSSWRGLHLDMWGKPSMEVGFPAETRSPEQKMQIASMKTIYITSHFSTTYLNKIDRKPITTAICIFIIQ